MDEAEWLATDDVARMLDVLTNRRAHLATPEIIPPPVSPRKLRLFACGCVRLCWPLLTDPRSRRAVEVAEAFADGAATWTELAGAGDEAFAVMQDVGGGSGEVFDAHAAAAEAFALCRRDIAEGICVGILTTPVGDTHAQAALLREVVGNPFRPVTLCGVTEGITRTEPVPDCKACQAVLTPTVLALAAAAYSEPRRVKCGRCKGRGSYHSTVTCESRTDHPCPDCSGTGMTTDGLLDDFRLTLVAEALEDAGCTEEALLRHLRGWEPCLCRVGADSHYRRSADGLNLTRDCCVGGWRKKAGPHVRGCWVVDLLLGKE